MKLLIYIVFISIPFLGVTQSNRVSATGPSNGKRGVIKVRKLQSNREMEFTNEVFTVVETMPSFNGGEAKLFEYITNNMKKPSQAVMQGIKGRVYSQFIVEKDGAITEVKIARGLGGGWDKEVKRVLESMPNWIPGKKSGSSVRVKYTLPIYCE